MGLSFSSKLDLGFNIATVPEVANYLDKSAKDLV